jgi:sugar/nucleoside kinase (ribokinase family)
VGPELKLINVTLGARGAAYVAGPAFKADPWMWPATRHRLAVAGPSHSAMMPTTSPSPDGDPTGCGDVWGSTCFARLLAGDPLEDAMREANRLAERNVRHLGTEGLYHYLQGRLAPEAAR